jgi:hypothetical protein
MKEDYRILLSTDGPYDNVLKMKPPMCFSIENCDFLLKSLEILLKDVSEREFPPSHRWSVIDATRPGTRVMHLKASL